VLSKESSEAIAEIYKQWAGSDRLFVPARALREYGKHRAKEVANTYSNLMKRLNAGPSELEQIKLYSVENSQISKELDEVRLKVNEQLGLYRKKLKELIQKIRTWNRDDDVTRLYAEIFKSSRVINHTKSTEELLKDLQRRNAHNLPPGFKDKGKVDEGIGDLHIWHTILWAGKEMKKNVVFVSNDQKSDWMVRIDNEALFVREELVNEFYNYCQHHFTIMNLQGFLKLAGASQKVIEEVVPAPAEVHQAAGAKFPEKTQLDETIRRFLDFYDGTEYCYIDNPSFGRLVDTFVQRYQFFVGRGDVLSKSYESLALILTKIEKLNTLVKRMIQRDEDPSEAQYELRKWCEAYFKELS